MSKELILKKLEQIRKLLDELESLVEKPFQEFIQHFITVRAAERNFQLVVDLASDINTHILIERGEQTPDSYRQSFQYMQRIGILSDNIADKLVDSAKIRNILVHEYDFEEDYRKFYDSVKAILPLYREYLKKIYTFVEEWP